jgi:predicted transcriptional regulator
MELRDTTGNRVRLPSGREVDVMEALKFCYDLTETDVLVLKVLSSTEAKREDDIAKALSLSKASVNRSLNKLISVGLAERVKEQQSKGGRPRYLYKSPEPQVISEKMGRELRECADLFSRILPSILSSWSRPS